MFLNLVSEPDIRFRFKAKIPMEAANILSPSDNSAGISVFHLKASLIVQLVQPMMSKLATVKLEDGNYLTWKQ